MWISRLQQKLNAAVNPLLFSVSRSFFIISGCWSHLITSDDVTNFLCLCQAFSQKHQKILEETCVISIFHLTASHIASLLGFLDRTHVWLTHETDRSWIQNKYRYSICEIHTPLQLRKNKKNTALENFGIIGLNRWFNKKSLLWWRVLMSFLCPLCNGTPAACSSFSLSNLY